jgi:hypothetical protein
MVDANGNVVLAPKPLVSTNPGDSMWEVAGDPWTIVGDTATMNNPNGNNNFLNAIINTNQTTAKPITFRCSARGNVVTSTNDWSINLILTDSRGLGGGSAAQLGSATVRFPAGQFNDQEFSITITPTGPAIYAYAYVFARYGDGGTVTVWDLEVYQSGDKQRRYGIWTSKIEDLLALANQPMQNAKIPATKILFYYGDIAAVNNMYSTQKAIDQFNKFDYVVGNPPSKNTTARQQAVQQALTAPSSKTKYFGYVQFGGASGGHTPTVAEIEAEIDDCASGGYYGVFLDMFGYDYVGVTRAKQNTIIDYIHSKGMKVFANSWFPEDTLSAVVNATANPSGTPTHLTTGDWCLIESFYQTSNNAYATSFIPFMAKYKSFVDMAAPLGVGVCTLAYGFDGATAAQSAADYQNAYLLTLGLGIKGFAYSPQQLTDQDVIRDTLPAVNVGSTLVAPFASAGAGLWNAITDEGVIWFKATDSPDPVTRSSGTYSTSQPFFYTLTKPTFFSANQVITDWQVSPDAVTWTSVTDPNLQASQSRRYLRLVATLRN